MRNAKSYICWSNSQLAFIALGNKTNYNLTFWNVSWKWNLKKWKIITSSNNVSLWKKCIWEIITERHSMNNPLRAIYFLRSRYFKRMFLSLLFRARRSSCAKLFIYLLNICNFISRVLLRHNIFLFFLSLHLTKLEHGLLLFLKVPHALEGEKGLTYRKFAFKNLSGDLFPDDRA